MSRFVPKAQHAELQRRYAAAENGLTAIKGELNAWNQAYEAHFEAIYALWDNALIDHFDHCAAQPEEEGEDIDDDSCDCGAVAVVNGEHFKDATAAIRGTTPTTGSGAHSGVGPFRSQPMTKAEYIERVTGWVMPKNPDDLALVMSRIPIYVGASQRTRRLIQIAYSRGVRAGARMAWDAAQPVTARKLEDEDKS